MNKTHNIWALLSLFLTTEFGIHAQFANRYSVTTMAGSGSAGYDYDDVTAKSVLLNLPNGIFMSAAGKLFFSDRGNNRIRSVSSSGIITTIAGTGSADFNGDLGPGTSAQISSPSGVWVDGDDNVYFADSANHRIRVVTASVFRGGAATPGQIRTLIGGNSGAYSGDGGDATSAALNAPFGIHGDTADNLYISDMYNYVVRMVSRANNLISTVAGSNIMGLGFNADGLPATSTQLNNPAGLFVGPDEILFLCDSANLRVREVNLLTGVVSTKAGTGVSAYSIGDGGPATSAEIKVSYAITGELDLVSGNTITKAHFTDTDNSIIRTVDVVTGRIYNIAGNPDTSSYNGDFIEATEANVNHPKGITMGTATGTIVFSDSYNNRIRVLTPMESEFPTPSPSEAPTEPPSDYFIETIAGTGDVSYGGNGGQAIFATFRDVIAVWADTIGRIFVVDSAAHVIRVIGTDGVINTVAGSGTAGFTEGYYAMSCVLNTPSGIWGKDNGDVLFTDKENNMIRRMSMPASETAYIMTSYLTSLSKPHAIWCDSSGNLYFTEGNNIRIFANGASTLATHVGTGSAGYSGDGLAGYLAELNAPKGLFGDTVGNLFIADTGNNAIRVIGTSGIVYTYAGQGGVSGAADGVATSSSFMAPYGLAVDPFGNLLVSDQTHNTLRLVERQSKMVSTIAGTSTAGFSGDGRALDARLNHPTGMAVDTVGYFYVADSSNSRVRRLNSFMFPTVAPTQAPTFASPPTAFYVDTLAGTGGSGYTGDGGTGTSAQISLPTCLFADSVGYLYISEQGSHVVRQINMASGAVSTVSGRGYAGTGSMYYATSLILRSPAGIHGSTSGHLMLSESGNDLVRRLQRQDGSAVSYGFSNKLGSDWSTPTGMWSDTLGAVYVTELGGSNRVRKVDSTYIISTVAGTDNLSGYSGDGGQATNAILSRPSAVWGSRAGTLIYIADENNHVIRQVDTITGIITTIIGSGVAGTENGPATSMQMKSPRCVITDPAGNFYIVDYAAHNVRYVTWETLVSTTVAGSSDGSASGFSGDHGLSVYALFDHPSAIARDSTGLFYVADRENNRIRRLFLSDNPVPTPSPTHSFVPSPAPTRPMTEDFYMLTIVGTGSSVYNAIGASEDVSPATGATVNGAESVWGDTLGNLFVSDTGNHRVRQVARNGKIYNVAGTGLSGSAESVYALSFDLNNPQGIFGNSSGVLFLADRGNNAIRRLTPDFTSYNDEMGSFRYGIDTVVPGVTEPYGVWVDGDNNLYFTSPTLHTVYVLADGRSVPVVLAGVVSSMGFSGDNGFATSATLSNPAHIFGDSASTVLYVADRDNNRVRAVSLTTKIITTVAGTGTAGDSGDGGLATSAEFRRPNAVHVDASGEFLVVDRDNHKLRGFGSDRVVSTIAGSGVSGFGGDLEKASLSVLNAPVAVFADSAGAIFLSDRDNFRVRKTFYSSSAFPTPAPTYAPTLPHTDYYIKTIAGDGLSAIGANNMQASAISIAAPAAVWGDLSGNLYLTEQAGHRVRKISAATGIMSTIVGTGSAGFSTYVGTTAQLNTPTGLWVSSDGTVFICDTNNNLIRYVMCDSSGSGCWIYEKSYGTLNAPHSVWGDSMGTIYFTETGSSTLKMGSGAIYTSALFSSPSGVWGNLANQLFVADEGNQRIRQIDLISGIITTVAGSGGSDFTGDDSAASSATLNKPTGVGGNLFGDMYVADTDNHVIRHIDSSGIIHTLVGSGSPGFAGDKGAAVDSQLSSPVGVFVDTGSKVYIVDKGNNRIRTLYYISAPSSRPSSRPSKKPTPVPSAVPSSAPTAQPTATPTIVPSMEPSVVPTLTPSSEPTREPTVVPTIVPTTVPSVVPSEVPSVVPSMVPSVTPSVVPSVVPSEVPSGQPTVTPTSVTALPTAPRTGPSETPSADPSAMPSVAPTIAATTVPTIVSTTMPSAEHTAQPTMLPTVQPSTVPRSATTPPPTIAPTTTPSVTPTATISVQPSVTPSVTQTSTPSAIPSTAMPSQTPSVAPSVQTSPIVTVQSAVSLSDVVSSELDLLCQTAVRYTVAIVMQLPYPTTEYLGSEIASSRRNLAEDRVARESIISPRISRNLLFNLQTRLKTSTQLHLVSGFSDASSLGAHLADKLTVSVSDGNFTRILQEQALLLGANLFGVRATAVSTTLGAVIAPPSFRPTATPTRAPTTSVRSLWVTQLQTSIASLPVRSDAVTKRLTYHELDVTGFTPYNVYGSCSGWSTLLSGEVYTSSYTHRPVAIQLTTVESTSAAATSFVSTDYVCSDAGVAKSILNVLSGVTVHAGTGMSSGAAFTCGSHTWRLKTCSTSSKVVSLCVNCANPCDTTAHCATSQTSSSNFSPTTIAPCVSADCSGTAQSSAIRILLVDYSDLEAAPQFTAALSLSASRTAIAVTAQLNREGTVHCGIVNSISTEKANLKALIALQNFASHTASNTNTSTVSITGLTPITKYTVYCYATGSSGASSTITQTLATAANVTTQCCKTLSVQLTSTSAVENKAVLNMVTITLSSRPSSTGSPLYVSLLSNAATQMFAPATHVVSGLQQSSTAVDGAITLKSALNPTTEGVYKLSVLVSGASASEYSVVLSNNAVSYSAQNFTTITLYSALAPPPAPVLLGARFSNSGASVSIFFDSSTNRGGVGTSFLCSVLFDFACAATSRCLWTDDSTVTASISGSNCVIPSSALNIATRAAVKAKCPTAPSQPCLMQHTWANATRTAVAIQLSVSPVTPTVVITSPSTIGSCDAVSLDVSSSSGSGGRAFTSVSITVVSSSSVDVTAMQSYLVSLSLSASRVAVIPSALVPKGVSYTFTATLCNFLSQCSQASRSVLVLDSVIPVVSLPGKSLRWLSRGSELSISSIATVATCNGSSTNLGLRYEWTVLADGVSNLALTSQSKDPSKLLFAPYTLNTLSLYDVRLTVTSLASLQSSTATMQVYMQPGAVHAVISGGTTRSVRLNDTTVIDGSASFDSDVTGATGSNAGLLYTWSCVQLSPTYNESCSATLVLSAADMTSERFVVLPQITASLDSVCEITLTVTDSSNTRSSEATVTVSLLSTQSPVISIRTGLVAGIINPDQVLRLTSQVLLPKNTVGNATWSVSDDSYSLSSHALSPLVSTILPSSTTPIATVYLVLRANTLIPGARLTFTMSCVTAQSAVSAVSSVVVQVNAPPASGTFDVTNAIDGTSEGSELVDLFSFQASFWQDAHLPLTYQFGYYSPAGSLVTLRTNTEFTQATSILPAGRASAGYQITCVAVIFDALNANTTVFDSVAVNKISGYDYVQTQQYVNTSLYLNSASTSGVLQSTAIASYLLNIVNCSAAPACAALNRLDCSDTVHTCGSCISEEYYGVQGSSNEACIAVPSTGEPIVPTGSNCATSADCSAFDQCVEHKCVTPNKTCAGDCSGRGSCVFVGSDSGEVVSECKVGAATCTAVCLCAAEYSQSASCSISNADLALKQTARDQVISSVIDLVNRQDADAQSIGAWMAVLSEASRQSDELSLLSTERLLNISREIIGYAAEQRLSHSASLDLLSAIDSATLARLNAKTQDRRRLLSMSHPSAEFSSRLLSSEEDSITVSSGINSTVSSDVLATTNTLQQYGNMISANMVPGEVPATTVQSQFRLSIQVVSPYISDSSVATDNLISANATITLPLTALETAGQKRSSAVTMQLDRDNKTAGDIHITALSTRSQLFQSDAGLLSNPLSLHLSALPCSLSSEECRVDVILQNSRPTPEDLDVSELVETECVFGTIASHSYTCANGHELNVSCNGTVSGTFTSQCPETSSEARCSSLLGNTVTDIGCVVKTVTNTTTVCSCPLQFSAIYGQSADEDTTTSDGYSVSYLSMLKYTTRTFVSTFRSAQGLNESTLKDGWKVMVTIGVFAFLACCMLFFAHRLDLKSKAKRHADNHVYDLSVWTSLSHTLQAYLARARASKQNKQVLSPRGNKNSSKVFPVAAAALQMQKTKLKFLNKAKIAAERKKKLTELENSSSELSLIEQSLPQVLHSASIFSRIKTELKTHHRWFCVWYYYSESFPRSLRVLCLICTIVTMLFFQSITYNLANPDDGECETLDTQFSCVEPKSPFATGESKCRWDYDSTECSFVEPNDDIKIVLFVAIFSALLTTPIAMLTHYLIKHVLAAPDLQTSSNSDSTAATTKYELDGAQVSSSKKKPPVPSLHRTRSLLESLGLHHHETAVSSAVVCEMEALTAEIKTHRGVLTDKDEKKEFDALWGLDSDGNFLSGQRKALSANPLSCLQREPQVRQAVAADLTRIVKTEREECDLLQHSDDYKDQPPEIGKRLLFFLQCDLLPGIQGKVLESKGQRDYAKVRHVAKIKKQIVWAFLLLLNAGMLFYILLFALNQTKSRQDAWFNSFIMWLFIEILLTSTQSVLVTHVLIPTVAMRGVNKVKVRLMDTIREYQQTVAMHGRHLRSNTQCKSGGGSPLTSGQNSPKNNTNNDNLRIKPLPQQRAQSVVAVSGDDALELQSVVSDKNTDKNINKSDSGAELESPKSKTNNKGNINSHNSSYAGSFDPETGSDGSFNAAKYLFVSTRVSTRWPDLMESQLIARFRSPWPRQSYSHAHDVTKKYNKGTAQVKQAATIILVLFLTNLLNIPPSLQDLFIDLVSVIVAGYLIVLHLDLWRLFPILAFLPALGVLVILHFAVQSGRANHKANQLKMQTRRQIAAERFTAEQAASLSRQNTHDSADRPSPGNSTNNNNNNNSGGRTEIKSIHDSFLFSNGIESALLKVQQQHNNVSSKISNKQREGEFDDLGGISSENNVHRNGSDTDEGERYQPEDCDTTATDSHNKQNKKQNNNENMNNSAAIAAVAVMNKGDQYAHLVHNAIPPAAVIAFDGTAPAAGAEEQEEKESGW